MAEETPDIIQKLCRTCLTNLQQDESVDLFLMPDLAKKLCVCTSLSVEHQDGFPTNICTTCYARLNDLHDFQTQCVKSVQRFKELMVSYSFIIPTVPEESFIVTEIPPEQSIISDPLLNIKTDIEINYDNILKESEDALREQNADSGNKETDVVLPVTSEDPIPLAKSQDEGIFTQTSMPTKVCETYQCSKCDEEFRQPLELREHMSTHTGNKPYECEICFRCFVSKSNLQRHLEKLHTQRNTFDCKICGKIFLLESKFKWHLKLHESKIDIASRNVLVIKDAEKELVAAQRREDGPILPSVPEENFNSAAAEHDGKLPAKGDSGANEDADLKAGSSDCDDSMQKTDLQCGTSTAEEKTKRRRRKEHPCTECKEVFRQVHELMVHMSTHTGKPPYQCEICDKGYTNKSILRDHLKRHAGIKNFICPHCGVRWTTATDLTKHIQMHNTKKNIKCSKCEFVTHNRNSMYRHVKIMHNSEKNLKCDKCEFITHSRQSLNMHNKAKHLNIRNYACRYCEKKFIAPYPCREHEKVHMQKNSFSCEICGKLFCSAKNLKNHSKVHEKSDVPAVENNLDNGNAKRDAVTEVEAAERKENALISPSVMEENFNVVNAAELSAEEDVVFDPLLSLTHKIEIDDDAFKMLENDVESEVDKQEDESQEPYNDSDYNKDEDLHAGSRDSDNSMAQTDLECGTSTAEEETKQIDESVVPTTDLCKLHPCTVEGCDQEFTQTSKLRMHLTKVHNKFPCSECEKVYQGKNELRKHMCTHTGIWPYNCKICNKGFNDSHKYRVHMYRHNGIKNFACPHCGVLKTTREELDHHLVTHTREKIFRCDKCEFSTHRSGSLRRHTKVKHLNLKNYGCQYCEKKFISRFTCKKHEKVHLNENYFDCKICGKFFLSVANLHKHLWLHEERDVQAAESDIEIDTEKEPEAAERKEDAPLVPKESFTIVNAAEHDAELPAEEDFIFDPLMNTKIEIVNDEDIFKIIEIDNKESVSDKQENESAYLEKAV